MAQFVVALHLGTDIVFLQPGDPVDQPGEMGDGLNDHLQQPRAEQHGHQQTEQQHPDHQKGDGQDVALGFGEIGLDEQVANPFVVVDDRGTKNGSVTTQDKVLPFTLPLFIESLKMRGWVSVLVIVGQNCPTLVINTSGQDAFFGAERVEDGAQGCLILEDNAGPAVFADDGGQGLQLILQLFVDQVLLNEERGGGGQQKGQGTGHQHDGVQLDANRQAQEPLGGHDAFSCGLLDGRCQVEQGGIGLEPLSLHGGIIDHKRQPVARSDQLDVPTGLNESGQVADRYDRFVTKSGGQQMEIVGLRMADEEHLAGRDGFE